MLTRTIFAVVLFAVLKCCHAQPLPVVSVVLQSAASNPDSVLPPGIAFRWKASTTTTNARVPLWTDSIQGYNFSQSTVNNQPTNNNGVVQFYGTNYFVATNFTSGTSGAATEWNFLLVSDFRDVASSQMVLGNTIAGGNMYVAMSSPPNIYNGINGGNAMGPMYAITYDIISARTGVGTTQTYTNGINGQTLSVAWNGNTPITGVGATGAGASKFNGSIREFIVWTNSGGNWTSLQVSNVHYYATNTYPHTP